MWKQEEERKAREGIKRWVRAATPKAPPIPLKSRPQDASPFVLFRSAFSSANSSSRSSSCSRHKFSSFARASKLLSSGEQNCTTRSILFPSPSIPKDWEVSSPSPSRPSPSPSSDLGPAHHRQAPPSLPRVRSRPFRPPCPLPSRADSPASSGPALAPPRPGAARH